MDEHLSRTEAARNPRAASCDAMERIRKVESLRLNVREQESPDQQMLEEAAILDSVREPSGQPDILSRIRAIFVESLQLNLLEDELPGVTRLSEIAGVDSMAAVTFVAAVEKEFHIVIEPELLELDFIEDLPRLAAYVEARGEARYRE